MNRTASIDKPAAQPRLVNQNGQRIGAKGQRTRQKLIDVTVELLQTHGLRDLTVAEVARVAQTSPATFYVYFDGVPEVVLSALEAASQTSPEMLALLDADWVGEDGLQQARSFVTMYCGIWLENSTVFRVRNLAAEEGDLRFIEARRSAVRVLLSRLTARVEAGRIAGRVAQSIDASANAAAILILLERLAAVGSLVSTEGPDHSDIKLAAANMVAHAMGAL
ncbi:TetR/AcrR family transcriptional regulator [Blastomonas sp.]|uniref:TetR/AcrR family transcriptional regulator n=1 Tax=Blastomonas sp. TaxID=1909299 RepID=UPI00260B03D3|nr:TetR family transcriptional regulator [Blastomonas sp.]MDM7956648.1 TetR family transcriptional regulator [Blastomonas sp.]